MAGKEGCIQGMVQVLIQGARQHITNIMEPVALLFGLGCEFGLSMRKRICMTFLRIAFADACGIGFCCGFAWQGVQGKPYSMVRSKTLEFDSLLICMVLPSGCKPECRT